MESREINTEKNIVTIGGGTGSFAVLSGLKDIPNISLTALVSMADDGGSTGILRKKWRVSPPGDARQCIVALSGANFLNHRFSNSFLKGHTFGNIILASLQKITGSFTFGLRIICSILNVKGKIVPIALDDAELVALLPNGERIEGESKIGAKNLKISDVEKISYKGDVGLNPVAKKAILEADTIIICPGDFYTSIVPNLIVEGFQSALLESKAKIIAIENLENTESDTYSNTYKNTLQWYLGKNIDSVIHADKSLLSSEIIVKNKGDVLKRSTKRHDPKRLAEEIKKLI